MLIALAAFAVPTTSAVARSTGESRVQALDAAVLVRINAIRAAHGLVALRPNAVLGAAAASHSRQMLADGYFAHDSAGGAPFWRRLGSYTASADGWSVGENLLWSTPTVDATRALTLWMASAEHRRNILAARWRDVGIAAVHADVARGTFGDRPVTVITTDFGVRD